MRTGIRPRTVLQPVERLQTTFEGVESMTRQDQQLMTDINYIYKRTQLGHMPIQSAQLPQFGDFTQVETYDQALNLIIEAERKFMELPAEVRKKYKNDPQVYYEETLLEAHDKAKKEKAAYDIKQKEKADREALEAAQKLVKSRSEVSSSGKDEKTKS